MSHTKNIRIVYVQGNELCLAALSGAAAGGIGKNVLKWEIWMNEIREVGEGRYFKIAWRYPARISKVRK